MNQSETEIEILAEKIARWARARSAEIERDRRLPDELVTRLREAGLLRATMPREVAAPELAPGRALRCAEAVARGDASAGWCVSIAITSALLVAYLPARSREEMFGGGRGVAAGVWAPRGTARSVDGGVVVSGRWPFCSGINHADIMFAGCFVDDRQVPSVVALNKDELQVLDTWHTLGLRGTGSHDCVADDVFVPADRVFSVFDGPIVDRPLYRFPVFGFFALSIGAAALGNARAAIDDLVELAGGKKGLGSTRTLAERSATQAAAATAESALGAARGPVLRGNRGGLAGQPRCRGGNRADRRYASPPFRGKALRSYERAMERVTERRSPPGQWARRSVSETAPARSRSTSSPRSSSGSPTTRAPSGCERGQSPGWTPAAARGG